MTDTPIFEELRLEFISKDVNIDAIRRRPAWDLDEAKLRLFRVTKKTPAAKKATSSKRPTPSRKRDTK
jgi:hypothetical protein